MANARPSVDRDMSTPNSRVRVREIRPEEDWAIAKECWRLAKLPQEQQWPVNRAVNR